MSRRASFPSPTLSGAIYLVTISEGQYRRRPAQPAGRRPALSGILLTLAAGEGAQLTPAAVPIALLPTSRRTDAEVGVIREGDRCYDEYRDCVDRVTGSGYALFPL